MSSPNSSAPDVSFRPKARRAFFLPEATINRLGGPVAADIMRLLVEEQIPEAEILQRLQIGAAEYQSITLTHLFKRELKAQLKLREHDEKFKKQGKIRDVPPTNLPQAQGDNVPAAVLNVQLPKGVSPQEYALKRINQVTPQAVERLVWLMHNAKQESTMYNAATKILGLNGIVEVEKSISVIADAESIIRELNKRGPYQTKKTIEAEDAEIVEVTPSGSAESPGESGPTPQETPE